MWEDESAPRQAEQEAVNGKEDTDSSAVEA